MQNSFEKSKVILIERSPDMAFLNSLSISEKEPEKLYKFLFETDNMLCKEELLKIEKHTLIYLFLVRAYKLTSENTYIYNGVNPDYYAEIIRFANVNFQRFGCFDITGNLLYHCYRYLLLNMVRLGRLSFEVKKYDFTFDVYSDNELFLSSDSWVLGIHIPGNDALTSDSVDESFRLAEGFFKKYHPDKNFKAYVCSSWLLDTQLRRFLKEDSNILSFQKRFIIKRGNEIPEALCDHIFACPQTEPINLKPKNRFQREILDFILDGGRIYSGKGYILK